MGCVVFPSLDPVRRRESRLWSVVVFVIDIIIDIVIVIAVDKANVVKKSFYLKIRFHFLHFHGYRVYCKVKSSAFEVFLFYPERSAF